MSALLLDLLRASATAVDTEALLAAALPALGGSCGATGVALAEERPRRGLVVVTAAGRLPAPAAAPGGPADPDVSAWAAGGAGTERHDAADGARAVLLVVRADGPLDAGPDHPLVVAALRTGLARLRAETDLADLAVQTAEVQHLAGLGDFDWHIADDAVTWSDEMFRIFGHEPGAFVPTYATFAAALHPDDRDRIVAAHQRAHAEGGSFEMTGRVVRPDGTVRHVSTRGEVVRAADGTPVRMRGTSVDVTDRVVAEHEHERSVARFRGLVDASPRAILLVDRAGLVVEANAGAHEMLAGDPVGQQASGLVDCGGSALGLQAHRLDGTTLVVDVVVSPLPHAGGGEEEPMDVVFVGDAAPRLEREALTARLGEARLRRRQALEINDNVVQGLVAARFALDAGRTPLVATYLEDTLEAARSMMNDLLDPLSGEHLAPGDLVRSRAADLTGRGETDVVVPLPVPVTRPLPGETVGLRILVVDDAPDLRHLTRTYLDRVEGLTVVGEAVDGIDGVQRAAELQPDLVVLDMAMPRMDGLQALPRIKQVAPGTRVIVFSGFDESGLVEQAVAAGADGYAPKSGSMRDLVEVVTEALRSA